MKFETALLHSKNKANRTIKSKATPIYQTSAFTFNNLEELEGFYQGNGNYLYTRVGNPNTDELSEIVARLEEAPTGVTASSGLAAIMAGVLAVAKSGDHIIATDDLYGGSFHLIAEELTQFGIAVSVVPFTNIAEVERAIKANTKLLYTESITNPLLRVEDLEQIVALAKKHNLKTLIDNTFATPFHCKPYLLGVDMVVHSATKYIGGHSDVTAGVIVGTEELMGKALAKVVNLGANLSPFEAWLTARGAKTLALRMKAQSSNAKKVAEAIQMHNYVEKVYYPFIHGEDGFGAMVTITLSDSANVSQFFQSLGWIKIVPTLAGVETSVSHPLTTSHRALPPEKCAELGITEKVIRISVGIEHADDIIAQLAEAIDHSIQS
ncbi:trans-sulfuration enzyme family protein [Cytobacillus purgationiresistens]|uniref:Cystathionine beta-lyase/cystathionine gamma-synthase n=1 Tax=Cytobacillus purgationiresistens TaxID=863449 RepID=A0ABU0AJQ5_9BACI|nr:PLP-dependent aspartate aminotransferase family protein [Cytobacillus purgationiresistens]MDQ0271496.1 cystathionine beta-lyase/cystathionine gamma-synthase [Cytobacillus purgationiresistens]